MSESQQLLVERVLSGGDPELARLAAEGLLPLPPEELVPIQVTLAHGRDTALAAAAARALEALPAAQVNALIQHGIPREVLDHYGRASDEPAILEAILRRRDAPLQLLADMGRRLSPSLQEILLQRQDAILARPQILRALEKNPALSPYARRRIGEYREHLLPREVPQAAREAAEEATEEDVAEAIEAARRTPTAGEVDVQTGLSDAQIHSLPLGVRRRLARGASRSLRMILVKDRNPQVAVAAIGDGGLADGDVEQIAASRAVPGEVLDEIGRHREWITKYKIAHALVHNPRTPPGVAVRLLPRLSVRELGLLVRDHNVSSAVRSQAERLYKMKRR